MALVNFRDVADRFGHVDGEFVACSLGFPEDGPNYKLRFYPWWEHPLYLEALDINGPWAFADHEEGVREVTIYPRGLVAFAMSRCPEVSDCWFAETGPFLWSYEPEGQIFVNESVKLDELVSAVGKRLNVTTSDLRRIIEVPPGSSEEPPFSLRLPRSVLAAAMETLEDLGVGFHKAHVPDVEALPVAFVIDDDNWIIADDFEVDFPNFEHRPEWFDPALDLRDQEEGEHG